MHKGLKLLYSLFSKAAGSESDSEPRRLTPSARELLDARVLKDIEVVKGIIRAEHSGEGSESGTSGTVHSSNSPPHGIQGPQNGEASASSSGIVGTPRLLGFDSPHTESSTYQDIQVKGGLMSLLNDMVTEGYIQDVFQVRDCVLALDIPTTITRNDLDFMMQTLLRDMIEAGHIEVADEASFSLIMSDYIINFIEFNSWSQQFFDSVRYERHYGLYSVVQGDNLGGSKEDPGRRPPLFPLYLAANDEEPNDNSPE